MLFFILFWPVTDVGDTNKCIFWGFLDVYLIIFRNFSSSTENILVVYFQVK